MLYNANSYQTPIEEYTNDNVSKQIHMPKGRFPTSLSQCMLTSKHLCHIHIHLAVAEA